MNEQEQKEYAQKFAQEFIEQLIVRGITAWPTFTVPGTDIEVPAGRVPGTLHKTETGYELRRG